MHILIGVDGSPAAHVACELVASRTWPTGTRVTLVGATEPVMDWAGFGAPSTSSSASETARLETALDNEAVALRHGNLVVDVAMEPGSAADLLMARADELAADLIVVGNRGRGPIASAVLGSVSAQLVDHASCPVLVARLPQMSRMVLATDGTASSRDVPRVLAAWGNAFRGLPAEVLSVAPREPLRTAADDRELALHEGIAELVADELMELGWSAAATTRAGDPVRQIVEEGRAWHADLIVTGSRGMGTMRRLLSGSVAHDVLMHADASLLVVRGHVPARTRGLAAALPAV